MDQHAGSDLLGLICLEVSEVEAGHNGRRRVHVLPTGAGRAGGSAPPGGRPVPRGPGRNQDGRVGAPPASATGCTRSSPGAVPTTTSPNWSPWPRRWREQIAAAITLKVSNAASEGTNRVIKLAAQIAFGFRDPGRPASSLPLRHHPHEPAPTTESNQTEITLSDQTRAQPRSPMKSRLYRQPERMTISGVQQVLNISDLTLLVVRRSKPRARRRFSGGRVSGSNGSVNLIAEIGMS
ncbi:transposase [Microbispora sp. CA-102843]|uniref:transposase n=1 Tax=Microbispora sp. CA-102843 TaxID=3239952 RepID=UPI003D9111AE